MKRALIVLALAFPASAQAQPPKVLQRADGALTAPASGAPRDIALRYVRANLDRLGLDRDDLGTLQAPTTSTGGGITTVRWPQAVDGIPAADSELRVNLASDGRVLNVVGEPAHDLRANTTPTVTAGEAVRAVQDATGSHRALPRAAGPKGATRATTYADDTTAELALDGGRLVWRVTYEAGPGEFYDAFVDARSGLVRRKVNLVKNATPASVWENYPGAPLGGSASLTRPRDQRLAGARRHRPQRPERPRLLRPRRQRRRRALGRGDGPVRDRRQHRLRAARRGLLGRQAVHLEPQLGQQLDDEPAPERGPGLLLRQPLPRPPGGGPDRLQLRVGQLRPGRRPGPGRDPQRGRRQPLQQRLDAHAAGRPLAADGAAAVPPERLPDDERAPTTARSSTTSTRTGSRAGS